MSKTATSADELSLPQQRYVEIIGELLRREKEARITEVAELLEVSAPSASEAVKRLTDLEITKRTAQQGIELTEKGWQIADQLENRHQALRRFMVEVLAMQPVQADEIACRVEHCVDRRFTDRLVNLARFLEKEHPATLQAIAKHLSRKD